MAVFDLDALLAESKHKPKQVLLGGNTYELPPVLPIMVPAYLREERITDALTLLFGAENIEAVAPLIGVDEEGNAPVLEAIFGDVYGLNSDVVEAKAHEAAKKSNHLPG